MADLAAFTDYEQEFQGLCNKLSPRINKVVSYETNADAAQSELRSIKQDIAKAKQLVSDMEYSARGIPEPTRRELGNRVRTYKESLDGIQREHAAAEAKFSRSALLAGGGAGGGPGSPGGPLEFSKSGAQRDRMAAATTKLAGGTTVLNDAQRRIEETIDVGAGIMGELERNRETLQRVRGNVVEVSSTMDSARRILRGMAKREVRTKIAVGAFAVFMIGIIAIVIYFITRKSDSESS